MEATSLRSAPLGSLGFDPASVPALPAHNISKFARDAKRDADRRAKWRHGDRNADVEGAKPRPWPEHLEYNSVESGKHSLNRVVADKAFARRHPRLGLDPGYDFGGHMPTDSRLAEEILEGEGSSDSDLEREPWEHQVTYSFDARRDPSDGSNILTQALGQAVERFEDQKTKKLVRDEYDVVTGEEEDAISGREVEEDFEMLF